jgi:uncharacterized membrane-anchored protein
VEVVGTKEANMKLFSDFFSTGPGIMSALVIAFMLGMGVFFVRYFVKHMDEDEKRAQENQQH